MRSSRTAARVFTALAVTMPLGLVACTSGDEFPLKIAEGVKYTEAEIGSNTAYLLTVDMTQARVDVLMPGEIAAAEKPTVMGEEAGAVGVINGDFFNNDDDENSNYTEAPLGPMISGDHMKAAIPGGQKQGPARPDGVGMESVLGIAGDQAMVTELSLKSQVQSTQGTFELDGLNQHALKENGIAAFDSSWGTEPRDRALCGNDEGRDAGCVDGVEVLIEDDEVIGTYETAGQGQIGKGQTVLLGREDGADTLARFAEGDTVKVDYTMESDAGRLTAAVGGIPLPLDDTSKITDDSVATRTAVGYKGNTLYMAVAEDASLTDIADYANSQDLETVMNLDGGGSSAMGTATDGDMEVRYRGQMPQRAVGNALAVFSDKPAEINPLEGRWTHQGDFPTDVRTLIIDEDNEATYFAEGSPVDYAGTVESGDGENSYTVDLEPTDSMPEAEDASGFTLNFTYQDDSLLVDNQGHEFVYEREEIEG